MQLDDQYCYIAWRNPLHDMPSVMYEIFAHIWRGSHTYMSKETAGTENEFSVNIGKEVTTNIL